MRTTNAFGLALGLIAVTSITSLAAAEEVVVVTATRTPAPISTIGSSVSVLTAEDLRKLGVTYIDDALRTLPGVTVTQNGGPGGFSSARIRGEEAYRTFVLIDGIRVDDPAGTQIATNFANILVGDIGQVEVVRGPQSLLYGADAIGGVIQILTDRPRDGVHYAADFSGGAYNTYGGTGAVLYGADKFGVSVSATRQGTEGFTSKVGDPELADPDGHRVWSLHGVFRADPSDSFGIEAVGHYIDAEAEFDGASAFPPFSPADPNRVLKTKEFDGRLAITNHGFEGRVKTELAYMLSTTRRDDLSDGLPFIFGSRFDGDRNKLSLLSDISLSDSQTLLLGAEGERVEAATDFISEKSDNTGIFAEWEAGFAQVFYLTAGFRYDDADAFGSHISGRGTAAWLPSVFTNEKTRLHASYGTGFRAPSPFERATNKDAGLPDLKEEESHGFDFGVSQSVYAQALSLDVTYFDQRIEDEIRFDNVRFTGYFQAVGESRSRGVEVSANLVIPAKRGWLDNVELQSAYTYTDSEVHSPDPENGLPRVRRPRHASATTLTLNFNEGAEQLAFTLRTAAKTEDGFREFRVPLDGYAAFDFSARAKIGGNAEVYLRGVNILNEQYQEVDGFATSDAAIYIGIRLRG